MKHTSVSTRVALALSSLAAASMTACGTPGEPSGAAGTPSASSSVGVLYEYYATGYLAESGAIATIFFDDDGTYALKETAIPSDKNGSLVVKTGTYQLDVGKGVLRLTDDASGETETLPFEAGPRTDASVTISSSALRLVAGALTGTPTALTGTPSSLTTISPLCTFGLGTSGFQSVSAGCNSNDAGLLLGPDASIPLVRGISQGIDVSYAQGTIDWTKVAGATKTFGFARTADGVSNVDPTFPANFAGLLAADMERGAYHFFECQTSDPVKQAQQFVQIMQTAGYAFGSDLAPAVDVEESFGIGLACAAKLQTFIDTTETLLGNEVTLTIYTESGAWARIGNPDMSTHPLWVSNPCPHSGCPASPAMPAHWSTYAIWQKSWTGQVPGITANKVDLDETAGLVGPP